MEEVVSSVAAATVLPTASMLRRREVDAVSWQVQVTVAEDWPDVESRAVQTPLLKAAWRVEFRAWRGTVKVYVTVTCGIEGKNGGPGAGGRVRRGGKEEDRSKKNQLPPRKSGVGFAAHRILLRGRGRGRNRGRRGRGGGGGAAGRRARRRWARALATHHQRLEVLRVAGWVLFGGRHHDAVDVVGPLGGRRRGGKRALGGGIFAGGLADALRQGSDGRVGHVRPACGSRGEKCPIRS